MHVLKDTDKLIEKTAIWLPSIMAAVIIFFLGNQFLIQNQFGGLTFGGSSGFTPEIAKLKDGEEFLVWNNRIAKDVFSGTWEATYDMTDLVAPDGSNSGVQRTRITLTHKPSKVDQGPSTIEKSNNGGPFEPILVRTHWSFFAMSSPSRGVTGDIKFFADGNRPIDKLFGSPSVEFILKSETEFVQKNGSSVGSLAADDGFTEEIVWKKVR